MLTDVLSYPEEEVGKLFCDDIVCVFRQGYPEGHYNSRSGWSSHSDYYAGYYSSQYDYGGRFTSADGRPLAEPRPDR